MTGAVGGHREVERKLRVHGLFRMPDLSDGVAPRVDSTGSVSLTAVYHDTADLRLAREGITLRRREGGADEGWHLKLPAGTSDGASVRDELRAPLASGAAGWPPEELLSLVRVVVRDAAVQPVATLRTERSTWLISDGTGGVVGELVDDTVSVLAGDAGPRSRVVAVFRELEVEDGPAADPAVLGAVVDRLVAAGAVAGESMSKAVRALGPAATLPPEVPEPPTVGPGDPAADAIAAHLARYTRALRARDADLRRDLPDAVHQMRVAARRLRSGLRVFRPLLDREWADGLRAELGWLADGLGAYRDAEVLLARLEAHLDELPPDQPVSEVRTLLRRRLRRTMAEARRSALETLDSPRYLALHDALVTAAATPHVLPSADQPGGKALPPLVRKAWRRLAKAADQLLDDELAGGAPDAEWHATRILAKKARYAADACAPVLGKDAASLAKQLSEVTEVLGEHQDGAVAADFLAEVAASGRVGGATGFALGLLHGVERAHVAGTREQFEELWPGVRRSKHRAWLG